MAGDVNGDGYDDVLVGAPFSVSDPGEVGRVYLYLGNPAGLSRSPAWVVEGPQAEAWFGSSVAAAGDVNGDGYGDILIGASQYDGGMVDEGAVYVYLGSPDGLEYEASWVATGENEGGRFGIRWGPQEMSTGMGEATSSSAPASTAVTDTIRTDERTFTWVHMPVLRQNHTGK